MKSFIDHKKITSYSVVLSEKLCTDFFAVRPCITGSEIKSFTPIEQINLFILKNLFEKWQDETQRLKSPYFDYNVPEMQRALQKLINTLSNHISVSKELFKPLVAKAIESTLLLALAPLYYLEEEILSEKLVTLDHLKKIERFHQINKPYFEAVFLLVQKSAEQALPSETILDFQESQEIPVEDTKEVVRQFSELLKIEINDILLKPEISALSEEAIASPQNLDIPERVQEEDPSVENETDIVEDINKIYKRLETSEINTKEGLSLNDLFLKKEATLNDVLGKKELEMGQTLGKITDLSAEISLGEQFIYIKELFNNDTNSYAIAISDLERLPDLDAALDLLKSNYATKFNWDFNNPFLQEFLILIERRYL